MLYIVIIALVFVVFGQYIYIRNIKRINMNARYYSYYNVLNKWLKIKIENKSLRQYFDDMNIKTVSIYGIGELGIKLYQELISCGVEVVYFIDKNCITVEKHYDNIGLVNPMDIKKQPNIDAIIITPIYDFEFILKDLNKQKLSTKIVSLKDIVDFIEF